MRMTLGSAAAGAAIVVFSVIFIVVAMPVLVFHPVPSDIARPYTALELQGRQVYEANGCFYCHSQYIRPQDWNQPGVTDSNGRVAQAGDYAYQQTVMLGQHRNGPDLSQEGGVHPDDWQYAHFFNPRFTSPKSIMPEFSFLWNNVLDSNGNPTGDVTPSPDLKALVAYVQSLGGKLADERYAEQVSQKALFANAIAAAANPNVPGDRPGQFSDTNQKALLSVVPQKFWTLLNPVPADQRSLIDGKTIYVTNCIGCHGVSGNGEGPAAQYFLNPFAYNFTDAKNMTNGLSTAPGSLYEHILFGIKGTAMPAFGQDLTVQNIWDLTNFLYTIPNGSLTASEPTMNMFIQWRPTPELVQMANAPLVTPGQGSSDIHTTPPIAVRTRDRAGH